jgi:hypothetical protein
VKLFAGETLYSTFSGSTMSQHNPYAPPTSAVINRDQLPFVIDPADRKKLNVVIKDAGQLWIAIVLCILCSAIGSIIIPFWYLARLIQWNGLAKKYPALLVNGAREGSIQAKFKSSQWKLIVGMVVGGCIFLCLVLYIVILVVVISGDVR